MGLYFALVWGLVIAYSLHTMAPRKRVRKSDNLRTSEVASVLGISQRTLLRRLAAGVWPEPMRDPENNYRMWRPAEVQQLREELERERR
jgi:predicted DNA-binding transcriptional regulator AlpA